MKGRVTYESMAIAISDENPCSKHQDDELSNLLAGSGGTMIREQNDAGPTVFAPTQCVSQSMATFGILPYVLQPSSERHPKPRIDLQMSSI